MLAKALPEKLPQLKYKALQQLNEITTKAYEAQLQKMLADMMRVLDGKELEGNELAKAEFGEPLDDEEKADAKEKKEDAPEPGEVDQETGKMTPEPPDPEDAEPPDEGEEAEKALDYSQPIVDRETRAFARVKAALVRLGYAESDFSEGGPLYGWSVNDLIDIVRKPRKED
jgi:hypothetical protein